MSYTYMIETRYTRTGWRLGKRVKLLPTTSPPRLSPLSSDVQLQNLIVVFERLAWAELNSLRLYHVLIEVSGSCTQRCFGRIAVFFFGISACIQYAGPEALT